MPILTTGAGSYAAIGGGFSPTSSQSSAFLARATGITSTTDKTNYDTMITGLVNDGVWALLDALYIFAAPDATTAKLNLVSTSFSPGVTTLAFSAGHGFTGDGTNIFDTLFIASTGGSHFVLNGGSIGVYNLSATANENAVMMGSFNAGGSQTEINLRPTFGNDALFSINASSGNVTLSPVTSSAGFWQVSRTNSTTQGASRNGAALTNVTTTASALDTVSITVFGRHDGPGASYVAQTTDQLSCVFIGGALANADIANMSARVNAFMTAYGINVY